MTSSTTRPSRDWPAALTRRQGAVPQKVQVVATTPDGALRRHLTHSRTPVTERRPSHVRSCHPCTRGRPLRATARPDILEPTDAVIRTVAACVCGSDLWRYRGIAGVPAPTPIGHEYVGVVEAVGDHVTTVRVGQFVVGGFLTSDNTCPVCRVGMHANCQNGTGYDGCQAQLIRVHNADGTLLATPRAPAARDGPGGAGAVRCDGHRLARRRRAPMSLRAPPW